MRNWSEKNWAKKKKKMIRIGSRSGKKAKNKRKNMTHDDTWWSGHWVDREQQELTGNGRNPRGACHRSKSRSFYHLSGMHFSFSRKIWYIYQYCWCCFLIKWTSPKWLWLKATSTKIFDATWWSRFASKACRAIWEPRMQWYFRRWKVDSKFMYNDE